MISNKALHAACEAYAKCDICEADPMRAALQAALPVLLEGKAEEIARVIDHRWADDAWVAAFGDFSGGGLNTPDTRTNFEYVRDEALAKANRIISILTGESE